MTLRRLILFTVLPATVLLGCGSDSGESSSGDTGSAEYDEAVALMNDGRVKDDTGSAEVTVDARDNTFRPTYIEVSAGTTVTFDNVGRNDHNVLPVQEGAFTPIEASDLEPDETATVTFDEVGDFPYYCSLHGTKTNGMIGGVRVVE